MPRKQTESGTESPRGKSFKSESGSFTSIEVGEEHRGIFMNCNEQEIMDRRTRAPKKIMVLKIRDKENPETIKRIACATMLQRCWEDIVDEYGNGDQQTAVNALRGQEISIVRGESTRTKDGNELGQYEIIVWG